VEGQIHAFLNSVLERGDPFHTLASPHVIGGWVDTSLGIGRSLFARIGD
jgi:hypothetical protein